MQGKASYMFKHYGVQNGLSQSTVYAIMQDRTGFIWIGTKEGLNRFDGTSFKIYRAYNDEFATTSRSTRLPTTLCLATAMLWA